MSKAITLKELAEVVVNLQQEVAELKSAITTMQVKKGPSSTREMTVEDAERIINGDLKNVSHKSAAETCGLSYGQVYSARGGYTFKSIVKK